MVRKLGKTLHSKVSSVVLFEEKFCDFSLGHSGQCPCPGRHATGDSTIGIERDYFGEEFTQLFGVSNFATLF
jgi:hypothetical protein